MKSIALQQKDIDLGLLIGVIREIQMYLSMYI